MVALVGVVVIGFVFLLVLIGIAVAGTGYSASRRDFTFDISTVFTHTFDAMGRAPVVMFGAPLAAQLLLGLLPRLIGANLSADARMNLVSYAQGGAFSWIVIIAGLLGLLIGVWLNALMVAASINALEEHERPQVAALTRSFSAFLPALGLVIVQGLATVLAFMLLIVPGLILTCMWLVAMPCLVRERTGVFGAFGRSAALTKGARWPILLMLLVVVLVAMVASAGAQLLANPLGAIGSAIVSAVISALMSAINSAGTASIYHELKLQKEGVDTGELETVFA